MMHYHTQLSALDSSDNPIRHIWTAKQRNAAIVGTLSWTLDIFDFFLLVFLLTDIADGFQVSIERVSVALVLTLFFRPLGALLFGQLAEKYGRKPILLLNILLFSLFELATAFSPSINSFLMYRALYGIAMGGIWGVASSITMESIPASYKGIISGIFQAGYPLGFLLAAVCYGLFADSMSWRDFFILGACPLLLLPFIYFAVDESPLWLANKHKPKIALWRLIKPQYRRCGYLILVMTAFTFLCHGTQDLYPTFLKVQKQLDHQTISLIGIAYSAGAIISGILFGYLANKFGYKKTAVYAVLLVLPMIYCWLFAQSISLLVLGVVLVQFFMWGAWSIIPGYLNDMVPDGTKAVLPGFIYQLGNLFSSGNALIQTHIAVTYHNNYALALAVVAILSIFAILLLFSVKRFDHPIVS